MKLEPGQTKIKQLQFDSNRQISNVLNYALNQLIMNNENESLIQFRLRTSVQQLYIILLVLRWCI